MPDSHERVYQMRDWDSLQVLVLPYDSLVWKKPVQSIVYPGGAWIEHYYYYCFFLGGGVGGGEIMKTRTVRGSDCSPALALSEEKDIIVNWK